MTRGRRGTQDGPGAPPTWQSRIVATGEESPEQLLANPANWRIHPRAQQDALAAVLDEVGWVQSVLVNRVTGHVVDGHLRVELAISRGEPTVPVSYVDLTENEEAIILASLDPLAALAITDETKRAELLASVTVTDEALATFLGLGNPTDISFPRYDESSAGMVVYLECPNCQHRWPR